ncbi:probable ubiquitin-like-specific protease 2A isoform X2 [Durio zibethinus]|uniref:Probable ubiquitin-like-specific protease 2A isoform X2 n=1 Tax=Durio zibethinus TaxID=66656 RepID=A0A6P5YWZ8_DURZI|nr:probable ubiquitin-like-specific protease 2A isoform X2 [Durio zibethinus]
MDRVIVSRGASQKSKRFDVFDFADEEERVERESAEILGRFKNPKKCRKTASPLKKYKFLQCFARPNEIIKTPIDLDVEVADCSRTKQKDISNRPIELDSEVTELKFLQSHKTWEKKKIDGPIDIDTKEVQATKTAEKGTGYKFGDVNASVTGQQCTFPSNCPMKMRQEDIFDLDTSLQSFSSSYKNERFGMISDDDDRIEMSSSAFASSHVECREEQLSVHGFDGHGIETENAEVVISPDFMFCRGIYCTEGQLTFSKTCLKFEGLTVNGTKKKFSFVWTVGDIISIDAEWIERVETAIMNLVLQSNNSNRAGNANETSAIELLKFSVCDPSWSERQEAIKSLSMRYKDIWNTVSDENEENTFTGQSSKFFSKPYFSDFHEHFEEVIYPKGDPDAISISKRDVELLEPETFINDTIVDFYIKYLKNKIRPKEQYRFHFFNSFFFRKLADLDKGLSSACQARTAFQRVCKWTKKVDIFEKDYIFIPVNYSLHWSLIVICHPGEVANLKDDEAEKLLKVPCILHMNSIRGSHRGLKNLFRSYLSEEWKERHREAADDVPSKLLNLQYVPLELPQQENSFDCGLFLLHYVELFLLQASIKFCPFKLNMNWFPPAEASLKRSRIRELIYEILEEQSPSSTSVDIIYKRPSSLLPGRSEQETGVQFNEQIGSSTKTCLRHSSNSSVKQGSSKFALSASPPTVLQGRKDSGLEMLECYEVGFCGGLLSQGNYHQINALSKRNAMSPIVEIEETSEEIAADSPSDLDVQQVVGSVTEPGLFMQYHRKDFRLLRTSWNQQTTLHFEDSAFNKSSDSRDSSEIGLEDDQVLPDFESYSHRGGNDKPESSSTSNEVYSDCIVEDSQESNGVHDESKAMNSQLQRFQSQILGRGKH